MENRRRRVKKPGVKPLLSACSCLGQVPLHVPPVTHKICGNPCGKRLQTGLRHASLFAFYRFALYSGATTRQPPGPLANVAFGDGFDVRGPAIASSMPDDRREDGVGTPKSARRRARQAGDDFALARQKRSAFRTALTPSLTARAIGEDDPARRLVLISTVCRGST